MAGRACHVWWAAPVAPDQARLDAGARQRIARLRRPVDRARHATGVVLADRVVAEHGGPGAHVLRRPGAAPQVAGAAAPLYVSVAHAGAWVAVALCGHAPVGVDVEPLEQPLGVDRLAEHVLSAAEHEAFARVPDARRREALLTWWTRKEAVVKATGDGLRVEPSRVVLTPPGEPPRVLAYPGRPELPAACTIADLRPGPDAIGAVAVLSATLGAVVEHDADALVATTR